MGNPPKLTGSRNLIGDSEDFGCALPDPDLEDRIAMDVASGRPLEGIIGAHNLASASALKRIIEKPRVARKIEGYLEDLKTMSARIYLKKQLGSEAAIDKLREHIDTAPIHDPKAIDTRKWFVEDQYAAKQREQTGTNITVEFVAALQDTTEKILKISQTQVIDIDPDDVHLHSGRELMQNREKQLAAMGSRKEQ